MQRIHEARVQAASDSNATLLVESTRRLEEELGRVKDMYEQELATVR